VVTSQEIKCRVHKHSFGPEEGIYTYDIRINNLVDSPTRISPSITMNRTWANYMAVNSLLGVACRKKKYYCTELGCEGVTAGQLYDAFIARPEVVQSLGEKLGINGYFDILKATEKLAHHNAGVETDEEVEEEASEENNAEDDTTAAE
jgi:hypothetical protein